MDKKKISLIKHLIAVMLVSILLMTQIPLVFSILSAINAVCFISFGYDKKAASKDWGRVPERTFLTLGFLGAFPALLLGRKVFKHKTFKRKFIVPMWGLFILQAGLVGYFLYSL
jgi:uncharacterized membrane protein YsdA (DUF1294 family)